METTQQHFIKLNALQQIYRYDRKSKVKFWFFGIMLFLIVTLFLPWTQNIKSKGIVTSLWQDQRPQEMNTAIAGRIVKWWVREGDYVKKGDTILQLSEIKEDYLDPNLVGRTQEQLNAKKGAIQNYQSKISTNYTQVGALQAAKNLKLSQLSNKLSQLKNKIQGEEAELLAANNDFNLSKDQYERQQKMFDQGLVSQTQLQQRNMSFQQALAKKIVAENKLAQTKQELNNVNIEKFAIEQEYTEKISKIEGDRFQNQSQIATSQSDVAKLENQVMNYTIRNGMYYILAPQDGQIVQAKSSGIGEVVKEGERITTIVPTRVDYCVEMFVRPVDLPLINIGQKVRFMFDGFPAIVFSGWPDNSYGTFGGKVVSYENTISPNGLFRVLVAEDSTEKPWPAQIKIGSGAQSIALLNDVPIWYELWRNINGFPPDYYAVKNSTKKK
ncbi:MAG: HlyD family efflux transporter periplasmic adaptor subunit [Chitinophagaceae bacterium]|nr:HlyD family efflux transporter periplasmic adaptor subunit [Chitinophagaceae bacterium]